MVGFFLAAQGVKRGHSTALLLASLGLAALGSLAFVAGDSLEIYFTGRLVMGIGSGGVWIGVTERYQPEPTADELIHVAEVVALWRLESGSRIRL